VTLTKNTYTIIEFQAFENSTLSQPTGHVDVKLINDEYLNEEVTQNSQIMFFAYQQKSITEFCYKTSSSLEDFPLDLKGNLNNEIEVSVVEKMKKEIHFWDFPNTVRFVLNTSFRRKLFGHLGDLSYVAKKLDISYSHLIHLKNGRYTIPKIILTRLCDLSPHDYSVVEENIVTIASRAGHSITIKLPLKTSIRLASLIGHVFGDGCIPSCKRQFEYCNNNPHLINEVEKQVYDSFGLKPVTKKKTRITYPSVLGDILLCFGAPIAPKTNSECLIPRWILFGEDSYKIAFLRAFFDDGGSVMYSSSYAAKGVNLHQTRHISCYYSLIFLLNQMKYLLKQFGINPGAPKLARKYIHCGQEHCVGYINITDYDSLHHFSDVIGLTQGTKSLKLNKILSRPRTYTKGEQEKLLKNILDWIYFYHRLSTSDIATAMNQDRAAVLKKLIKLKNRELVEQDGRVAINRSYYWKIKEVNQCDT